MKVKEFIKALLEQDMEDEVFISIHTPPTSDKDGEIYHYKPTADDIDCCIGEFQQTGIFAICEDAELQ